MYISVNVHVYMHGSQYVCECRIRCWPSTPLVYTCVFVQRIEGAFIEVSFLEWDLGLQFKTHRNEGMSSIEISFATRAELGGRWPLVGLPCYTQAGKLLRLL